MKRRLLAIVAALTGLLVSVAWSGHAQADSSTTTVPVPGTQPWTDTGISVSAGDSVSITASGTIFIAGSDPGKTPAGEPSCVAANSATDTWVAPGLTCWSMIGRIGNNSPFEVGAGTGFSATVSGELFLGVNDNFFPDNSGAWSATIAITPPSTYVALGDSYSSGEGNSPYLAGTDTSTNQCHRSATAYPELVAQQLGLSGSINFDACSGAFVQNLTIANPSNEERQQLYWLTAATKLVTLTVGGNNVNFAGVMKDCVLNPTCELSEEVTVDQDLAALNDNSPSNPVSLAQLYMKIAAAAPNATILVLGYPRFFPIIPPRFCSTGAAPFLFNRLQMAWLNLKIFQLDAAIQKAVNQAAATGAKIKYVNAYNAFQGNELCTSNPYLYGAMLTSGQQALPGSFHPTAAGQAALAKLMEASYP